jgi:hypothetical protein
MAHIYRALFSVNGSNFVAEAPRFAEEWLRWKFGDPELAITEDGSCGVPGKQEAKWWFATGDGRAVFRARVYEEREEEQEQVRTTFTAFADAGETWALTDIERWAISHAAQQWVPLAPSIVGSILKGNTCQRGPTLLPGGLEVVGPKNALQLVETVTAPGREIPVVVVSPNPREGHPAARSRALELAKSLAGVAPVYLSGAVSAFSKAMLEVHDGLDVYGGAIRIYQPGAGSRHDRAFRHRLFPLRRFEGKPPSVVMRLVAGPLLARAAETPPPRVWRDRIRELLEETDDGSSDLLELYEEETETQRRFLDELSTAQRDLEERFEELRGENEELLGQLDRLRGHVRYLQGELASHDRSAAYAALADDPFVPEWCAEVVAEARARLDYLKIDQSVDAHAASLDEHVNSSWARRGWSALLALNDYAKAKADGFRGDFFMYCESADDGAAKIPTRWIGRHESKNTKANRAFSDLRRLPVDQRVESSGRIFMEEHIKIEQGGTPAPRIHFYDDHGREHEDDPHRLVRGPPGLGRKS